MANSTIQRYFGGLTRDPFLFAFTSLFADISTEMLYPVLPVFLTQTLRASGSIVGLVDGFAGMNSQGQANAFLYMGVTTVVAVSDLRRGVIDLSAYCMHLFRGLS